MEFIKMKVKGLPTLPIEEFENFQGNLKILNPESAKKLKASMIKNGFNAPIFIWAGHKFILDGHQRIKVLLELYAEGYSLEGEPELPYVPIEAENEKQAAEMVLTYNSQYGHLDHSSLLEFAKNFELDIQSLPEILDLKDISIEKFVFDVNPDVEHSTGTLKNDYIMAPFSILDTRSAEWQERKRSWLSKMPQLDKTREGVLKYSKVTSLKDQFTGGSSIFDPVLAELMYAWFCPKGGKTLDIYMGESTKAFVACMKGLHYYGVEIRKEQIDENQAFISRMNFPKYFFVHGDAKNVQELLKEEQFDFAFTSPPYYDLEEYEGGEQDISTKQTYEQFRDEYHQAIKGSCSLLKPGAFYAIKVSEIRDKKTGNYRNFVADTIDGFLKAGMNYYNEIILINSVGTLPLRVRRFWEPGRKVGRMHQNILIFKKQ
jgi:16S rRNA G966 N2-methylase RsmD